jgi:hypothetical protein
VVGRYSVVAERLDRNESALHALHIPRAHAGERYQPARLSSCFGFRRITPWDLYGGGQCALRALSVSMLRRRVAAPIGGCVRRLAYPLVREQMLKSGRKMPGVLCWSPLRTPHPYRDGKSRPIRAARDTVSLYSLLEALMRKAGQIRVG